MLPNAAPSTDSVAALSAKSHPPFALYVHIPFCRTRCTYCAFNTYAGLHHLIAPYIQALLREIQLVGQAIPAPTANTLYWGGGTPSQVPAALMASVIKTCQDIFHVPANWEISFEANPGDTTIDYLTHLHRAGVNRLSIGMQSAHQEELRFFARRHTTEDVRSTIQSARSAGFRNISLDLIYGIPGQNMARWQASVETALSLSPDHLSFYSLSIEIGTVLYRQLRAGEFREPDSDLAADMYEWAADRLASEGFQHYEISNWARPGHECRHNVHVWRNLPYLGFGAGAHGYAAHTRYANIKQPASYIERIREQKDTREFPLSAAVESSYIVDQDTEMSETVIMGLRLTKEGVSEHDFFQRFQRPLSKVYSEQLERLMKWRLLEYTPAGRYRLTRRGRLLGNRVFAEFV